MKKISVLFALVLVTAACDQNPTKKIDERFKSAPIDDGKDHSQKPVPTHNLLIDGPNSATFAEERENHFAIEARSLIPEYDLTKLTIENMEEFPGATFIDGVFSWTPPLGSAGNGVERDAKILVRAYSSQSKKPKAGWLTHDREIQITITREPKVPHIVVQNLPDTMHEEDWAYFEILVQTDDPQSARPTLQFKPPANSSVKSLANFVEAYDQDYDLPSRTWTFKIRLTTYGELASTSAQYGFRVFALSPLGHMSSSVEASVKIYTQLDHAQSSWKGYKRLTPETKYTIPFIIYNPKGEGRVAVTNVDLPTGINMTCDGAGISTLECELELTTPKVDPGKKDYQTVKVTVVTSNVDTTDTDTTTDHLELSIVTEAQP